MKNILFILLFSATLAASCKNEPKKITDAASTVDTAKTVENKTTTTASKTTTTAAKTTDTNTTASATKENTNPDDIVTVNYTVKKGDNLGYISDWFDCTVPEIKKWNNLSSTKIVSGQKLKLQVQSQHEDQYAQINKMYTDHAIIHPVFCTFTHIHQ